MIICLHFFLNRLHINENYKLITDNWQLQITDLKFSLNWESIFTTQVVKLWLCSHHSCTISAKTWIRDAFPAKKKTVKKVLKGFDRWTKYHFSKFTGRMTNVLLIRKASKAATGSFPVKKLLWSVFLPENVRYFGF